MARSMLMLPPEPDDKPPDLEDWGLNFPFSYVFPIFIRWYRSDFHALPNGDQWDEQDPQLMDDLYTLLSLLDFHVQQLKPAQETTTPETDIYSLG